MELKTTRLHPDDEPESADSPLTEASAQVSLAIEKTLLFGVLVRSLLDAAELT